MDPLQPSPAPSSADPTRRDDDAQSFWAYLTGSCRTERDRANQRRLNAWWAIWGVSFLGATYLLSVVEVRGVAGWLLALVPSVVGVGIVTAYLTFLRETDEFTRRVQLEGIALGFVVGLMLLLTYAHLELVGAPPVDAFVIAAVMFVAWGLGQFVALLRYR